MYPDITLDQTNIPFLYHDLTSFFNVSIYLILYIDFVLFTTGLRWAKKINPL